MAGNIAGLQSHRLDSILLGMLSGSQSHVDMALSDDEQARLLRRAQVHKASVLLARIALDSKQFCAAVREELKERAIRCWACDARLAKATSSVVGAFQEAKIPVLAQRGAVIWRALELPGPSKISTDVDLMVPPDALSRANALLLSLGYEHVSKTHAHNYISPDGVPVDLHCSLLGWNRQTSSHRIKS